MAISKNLNVGAHLLPTETNAANLGDSTHKWKIDASQLTGSIPASTNSGVRSVAPGSSNGTISVNTNGAIANVAVKGLGSAAYTASTAYDAAGKASTAESNAKSYTDTSLTWKTLG